MTGKLHLVGDIHAHMEIAKLNTKNWPEQKTLSVNDVLFILGDFGLVWDNPESKEEQYWLKWLLKKNCTVCFLDGNHENHDKLKQYPIVYRWGGRVQLIKTFNGHCIYRLMRGEVYTICNRKLFVMGGADSTDKQYRTEGKSWWAGETISDDDVDNAIYNLKQHNYTVDYVLTHTAPQYIVNMAGFVMYGCPTESMERLSDISRLITFKEWHFGHLHIDESIYDTFHCHYNKIVELK